MVTAHTASASSKMAAGGGARRERLSIANSGAMASNAAGWARWRLSLAPQALVAGVGGVYRELTARKRKISRVGHNMLAGVRRGRDQRAARRGPPGPARFVAGRAGKSGSARRSA